MRKNCLCSFRKSALQLEMATVISQGVRKLNVVVAPLLLFFFYSRHKNMKLIS
jgi:hypothetical protein